MDSHPSGRPSVFECCGVEAPTIKASLNRHVGAIILMVHLTYGGYLCKRCISGIVWRFTSVTLLLGCWGLITLIVTSVVLVNNVVVYLRNLSLPMPKDNRVPA